jgi:hypothetical protein
MLEEMEWISRCLVEVLSRNLPGGMEEDHEKTQDFGILAEIYAEHVQITSLSCHRNAKLFDKCGLG